MVGLLTIKIEIMFLWLLKICLGHHFILCASTVTSKKKKDLMGEQVPFKYDLRAHEAQEIINFQLLRLTSANIFGNLICLRKLWRAW